MKSLTHLLCFLICLGLGIGEMVGQSPVLHLKMDREGGKDLPDYSYKQNAARMIGDVSFTDDRFGNGCRALSFNGAGYLTIDHHRSLNLASGFTMSSWVKLPLKKGAGGLQWLTLVCKGEDPSENDFSPAFRVQLTSATASVNTASTKTIGSIRQGFPVDEWFHVAVTYNGKQLRVFQNGQETSRFVLYDPIYANSEPLNIGRDIPGDREFFEGKMDDLRLFNTVLGDADIWAIYQDESDKNLGTACPQARPRPTPSPRQPVAEYPTRPQPATPAPPAAPIKADPADIPLWGDMEPVVAQEEPRKRPQTRPRTRPRPQPVVEPEPEPIPEPYIEPEPVIVEPEEIPSPDVYVDNEEAEYIPFPEPVSEPVEEVVEQTWSPDPEDEEEPEPEIVMEDPFQEEPSSAFEPEAPVEEDDRYSFNGVARNNLTLLLDVSGSMDKPGKLPMLKEAFLEMVVHMRPDDKISIISFSGSSKVILDGVSATDEKTISRAIERLSSSGKTNGKTALKRAYKVADRNYIPDGNNRIILATDGSFPVRDLYETAQELGDDDMYLSVFSFGDYSAMRKALLDDLAKHGNGNHEHINRRNVDSALLNEVKAIKTSTSTMGL